MAWKREVSISTAVRDDKRMEKKKTVRIQCFIDDFIIFSFSWLNPANDEYRTVIIRRKETMRNVNHIDTFNMPFYIQIIPRWPL
tara:strand:+ start:439 stop:690 length:252 start_codon:yes stop_codon:yes gene_type:complete